MVSARAFGREFARANGAQSRHWRPTICLRLIPELHMKGRSIQEPGIYRVGVIRNLAAVSVWRTHAHKLGDDGENAVTNAFHHCRLHMALNNSEIFGKPLIISLSMMP